MTLRALLVADPAPAAAQLVLSACQRLAQSGFVATTTDQLLLLAGTHRPELILYGLELRPPEVVDIIPKLIKLLPESLVLGVYREMSIANMQKLQSCGIAAFFPHPVDVVQVFAAVSRRFGVAVRQHPRFAVLLNVLRADGVLLGQTRNMSLGGLSFLSDVSHRVGDSLLLRLQLGAGSPTVVRLRILAQGPACAPETQGFLIRGAFENLRGPGLGQLSVFLSRQTTPA